MTADQLMTATGEKVIERSYEYRPYLYRRGEKAIFFEVGDHRVRLNFPEYSGQRFKEEVPEDIGSGYEVEAVCSCPFWQWQGPEHWAQVHGYQLTEPRGTAAYPTVRDPDEKHLVCKHVASVLRYLKKRAGSAV